MLKNLLKWMCCAGAGFALSGTAMAVPVTFTASNANLAAQATFNVEGDELVVTLANTGLADVLHPAEVLTAVFFDLNFLPTLTPSSAVLAGGSTVHYDPDGQPAGGVVGGEWAYQAGLTGAPGNAARGISSTGLGLFGAANFPGPNLAPPANGAVNGISYGLLSAGDNPATGNSGGILDSGGLVKNAVQFRLSGATGLNLTPGVLGNVTFQYGTSLTEPQVPGVPEPPSLLLMAAGLAGLLLLRLPKLRMRRTM